jgi:hypothetical protein
VPELERSTKDAANCNEKVARFIEFLIQNCSVSSLEISSLMKETLSNINYNFKVIGALEI